MASGPAGASGAHDAAEETPGPSSGAPLKGPGGKKSRLQTFKDFFVKKRAQDGVAPEGDAHPRATPSPAPALADRDTDPGWNSAPPPPPPEVLRRTQDGLHGRVKALQMQLKQAIRLGSPGSSSKRKSDRVVVLSGEGEDTWTSPGPTTSSQRSSGVVHSCGSDSLEGSESDTEQTPGASVLMDFSGPAGAPSCLDCSAAHHRIALRARARAERRGASRELRRRDLLLGDTQDKPRPSEEEESKEDPEELSGAQVDESRVSLGSSQGEHDGTSRSRRASATSTVETPDYPWENPLPLELHTADLLIPGQQGSLLEEVLSSLKGPLTSALLPELGDAAAEVGDEAGEDGAGARERSRNQTDSNAAPVQRAPSVVVLPREDPKELEDASREDGETKDEPSAKESSEEEDYWVLNGNDDEGTGLGEEDRGTFEEDKGSEGDIEAKDSEDNRDEEDASTDEEDSFEEQRNLQEEPKEENRETVDENPLEVQSEEELQKTDQAVEDGLKDLSQPEEGPTLPSDQSPSFVVTTSLDLCLPKATPDLSNEGEGEGEDEGEDEDKDKDEDEDKGEGEDEDEDKGEDEGEDDPEALQGVIKEIRYEGPKLSDAPHGPLQQEPVAEEPSGIPFGVRLRKTWALPRYVSGGESPGTQVESEAQENPSVGRLARRTSSPKPAEEPRRTSDGGVASAGTGTPQGPSWISVARQKQKIYEGDSPAQVGLKEEEPPYLSSPVSKDHPKPFASPVKVSSLLDVSKPAPVEKERRSTGPPAPPPAPVEPPWLALAKEKAKAWSERPQIVQ